MNILKKIGLFVAFAAILSSCGDSSSKKNEVTLVNSNGRAGHALFVVDNDVWKGRVGEAMRAVISEPVVGLPQEEAQLDYAQVPEHLFGKMMQASRSVVKIKLDGDKGIKVKHDIYARPQIIIELTAPNKDAMIELIGEDGMTVVRLIQKQDLENIQVRNKKNAFASQNLKTFKDLGISMVIPKEFAVDQMVDTGDFLWMTQRLTGGIAVGDGSMNLLVYSYPIDADHPFTPATVIRMRDEMGEQHVPGGKEGQYMITEKARTPVFYKTKLAGYDCIETHSTWEMKDDYMAGPFVNYAIADWANNRVIVLEGFVYAPSVDKRDYLMELEAIIKSIKINN